MILLIFLIILGFIIFTTNTNQSSGSMTCTQSENGTYGGTDGTCTLYCTTNQINVTASNSAILQAAHNDASAPTIVKNGSICTFNYHLRFSGGPMDITLTAGDKSFVITGVTCVFHSVKIKTNNGIKMAKDIILEDKLEQLDGTYKSITKIEESFATNDLWAYQDVILTGWHPVRFKGENEYTIVKHHTNFEKTTFNGKVYNFQLESYEDDILFENKFLVAESLNDLSHGEKVIRKNIKEFL